MEQVLKKSPIRLHFVVYSESVTSGGEMSCMETKVEVDKSLGCLGSTRRWVAEA